MKFFGWRRAELATWFKWVPAIEQIEMFDPKETRGLTEGYRCVILDTIGSVSASVESRRPL